MNNYTLQTKFFFLEGVNIGITLSVLLPVHMSCKLNSSLMDMDVPILLLKLDTAVVYNLKTCMKGDYSGPTYFKGDNFK